MLRERALKVALVVVGLLFVAAFYPMLFMKSSELMQMFMSVYVTLGVFLLISARRPSENRSLILFGGWSSVVHAAVMAVQAIYNTSERVHLVAGTVLFMVIGLLLIVLAPKKEQLIRVTS